MGVTGLEPATSCLQSVNRSAATESDTLEVVDLFMSSPGICRRDGWIARALSNGAILIGFTFWNADTPEVAEWIVIPETSEVRYQNLHGKYMSWAPDY